MNDIVERLRTIPRSGAPIGHTWNLCDDAADEIEKLRTERDALRAALRPFANALQGHYHHQVNDMQIVAGYHKDDLRFKITLGDFREARAALGEKE